MSDSQKTVKKNAAKVEAQKQAESNQPPKKMRGKNKHGNPPNKKSKSKAGSSNSKNKRASKFP